ncbi:FprA family A-type flavoprotein [Bullifex sp.]|uniref:FprA family A-type flavoprotein n=1 Tax=Bullifex sp. TaxID=2815808 RepID=UPI002A8156D4|nr:FprA family A-type flavoprotein [Bullifex sp.]MDY4067046.1 FprA family A-type flavoprotein [Bullifex sp.]
MRKTINDNVTLFRYEKSHDDLFEGCWPIRDGVSINAYCVCGTEKKVLIDYTESGASFDADLADMGLRLEDIDVLVLNHMEPDHTGALNVLFTRCPNIEVYATRLGATETETLYGHKNVHIITNGEELNIGGKTLVFYATPNIHWPDTMMTYLKEDGILFSCDAFGAFGSYQSVFDDELTDREWALLKPETERYYASIVASFSPFVLRGIKALSALDIKVICPSHGIVWRKDPLYVVTWYQKLATYLEGPREKEITILISSMYGNTLSYISNLVQMAKQEGVVVHTVRIPDTNDSYALEKVWRSEAFVVAAPTYEMELFPSMAHTLDLLNRKAVKGRKVLYFGSSLWSGGAAKEFNSYAEKMKLEVVDAIEFRGKGTPADRQRIEDGFKKLIEAIK